MRTMNPLNLFSPRASTSPSAGTEKATSKHDTRSEQQTPIEGDQHASVEESSQEKDTASLEEEEADLDQEGEDDGDLDEKSPLLAGHGLVRRSVGTQQPPVITRIASAIIGPVKVVVAAVFYPSRWLIACFYDDLGYFSPFMPLYRIGRTLSQKRRRKPRDTKITVSKQAKSRVREALVSAVTADGSALTSESEPDSDTHEQVSADDSPARNTRSKSPSSTSAPSDPPRKSIRIKAVNQEELRRHKQRRALEKADSGDATEPPLTIATIKSPTGPTSSLLLTKYPRAPAPPRPLVPRRQPSYSLAAPFSSTSSRKTLVIDLDETLIHSMAKGGRMSTGHMVEVKLSTPIGVGNSVIAPQVPILYYVHKRPYCDEFLRKVSKWYNLIIFTASVQEYADPVIDWLELERKYFSARYYRQHCTIRNGAYIKDLSQVEPDLSKVMILDNSPICYIFHEDNAIPIEGWISDPTDNDLLHLIPLLEGLQHTTDVRALLALRLGESIS